MQLDELLQSKALPTYRGIIKTAIASGHQIDILYHAAKAIRQGDESWAGTPKFLVSTFDAEPIEWTRRQIANNSVGGFPPSTYEIRISDGWRLWRSSRLDCAEVRSQETSLLSAVPVNENGTFYSVHVLRSVRSLIQFRQRLPEQVFSVLFFAECLCGARAYFKDNWHEDAVSLQDDNIVIFQKNCTGTSFVELGAIIVRSMGQDISIGGLEKLVSEEKL